MRLLLPSAVLAATLALAPSSRADVPFFTVYLDNAVEVTGQEKFPEWIVVVFPSAPPSGRPAAWPALVEPGFHTQIDIKVLGEPRIWILERSALEDLKAAARDNDDQLDGPVAALLRARGVECADVKLEEKASLPGAAPAGRLFTYALEDAAKGRCEMKLVKKDFWEGAFNRGPSWASFAPKRKKPAPDAGASAGPLASSAPSPPVGIAAASAVANAPPASPSAAQAPSAAPAASAREAPAPEPSRPRGCGCAMIEADAGAAPLLASAVLAIAARRRRRNAR